MGTDGKKEESKSVSCHQPAFSWKDLMWGNEQGNGFRTLVSTDELSCENAL